MKKFQKAGLLTSRFWRPSRTDLIGAVAKVAKTFPGCTAAGTVEEFPFYRITSFPIIPLSQNLLTQQM